MPGVLLRNLLEEFRQHHLPSPVWINELAMRTAALNGSTVPPLVLMSSCLYGRRVTYRGSCSHTPEFSNLNFVRALANTDGAVSLLRLVPVCPEVEAMGLSVPRRPIRLVAPTMAAFDEEERKVNRILPTEIHVVDSETGTRHTKGTDPTALQQMVIKGKEAIDTTTDKPIYGAIMKARSPSCGAGDARLYKPRCRPTTRPSSPLADSQDSDSDASGKDGTTRVEMDYVNCDGFFVAQWVRRNVHPHPKAPSFIDDNDIVVTERKLKNDTVLLKFLTGVLGVNMNAN